MALFLTPADHAANPPDSWEVVKVADRCWHLRRAGAEFPLDTFTTRHAAEAAKESSWLVALYDKERRWFAGETVAGWKPYVPADDRSDAEIAASALAMLRANPAVVAAAQAVVANGIALQAAIDAWDGTDDEDDDEEGS